MKVLWVCNVPFANVADYFGLGKQVAGGWMSSLAEELVCSADQIDLVVVAPYSGNSVLSDEIDSIKHVLVPFFKIKNGWRDIIESIKPDLVHLHGSEYDYSLTLIEMFPNLKYLLSVQGIKSYIARHYTAYLSHKICKRRTLRDVIRWNNIYDQARTFKKHHYVEEKLFVGAVNICGRTKWDFTCAKELNPNMNYYFCNESLRDCFYDNKWTVQHANKYQIFFSQATYPVKGLHLALLALPEIIKYYPESIIVIAGANLVYPKNIKERIKQSYYGKYIRRLIRELRLERNVRFTGPLSASEMAAEMLSSHVFLSASSIENSPNSLGEAMLLGMPIVSSNVGGVADMLINNAEGFLYPADEYYMISHYIMKFFADDSLSTSMGRLARIHAQLTHDRLTNSKRMIEIYKNIVGF